MQEHERIQRLGSIVNDPEIPLEKLRLLPTNERRRSTDKRVAVALAVRNAVTEGGCRGIPSGCILCAQARIGGGGVLEIVSGQEASQYTSMATD